MKLGKPPIIQAWIEFRFDHAAERPEWDWQAASSFFDQFLEEYPEREVAVQHQLQIVKVESNEKPRVVDERVNLAGMRAFRADRGRCVQVSQDTLACNFMRTAASGYEGFDTLKREALAKLRAYVDFFRPTRLLQFAMQYVDLVRIPIQHNRIELKDYFTLGQDLPEAAFGPILNFLVQYTTRPPDSRDLLEVRLWNESPDPQGPTGQFRMDWRLMAFEDLSFAEDVLGHRLDQAHDRLLDCFKKSFTPQAWAMLEPAQCPGYLTMILQGLNTSTLVRPADPLFAGSLTTASRSGGRGDFFDVLRREIKSFPVGIACYQLRSALIAAFYPRIDGESGRLSVTPSWLSLVGYGTTLDEAWQDWAGQFHVRFQTLLARRHWEMNADEKNEWQRIEQMVDVPAYRRETPYVVRQIGWLTHRRPIPNRVCWEDGRREWVVLSQMPPEFAALHEGDRFEAEVQRHAVTGRLIRALVVRRLPALRGASADETVWSSLPTTAVAPAVEWDEFE